MVYQGDEVYVDGQPAATAREYSQQAIELANTPVEQPPPPAPPEPGQPGLQNLTQDVAISCLVHFGPDTTQTWLLIRLKQPEMANAPQGASEETTES